MKRATVYHRKGKFFAHASSQTTAGVWILSEPCLALDDTCTDHELGSALLGALAGSENAVAHPQSWKGLLDPLLTQAGVKSWGTFSKTATCLEVEADAGHIALIPTLNLGVDAGFQADPSQAVSVDAAPAVPAVLGASARKLLA
jgi:hypothetical protein